MSQIKVTPSFLIRLMQSSRGLKDKSLMKIIDQLRDQQGVLSGEDVEALFADVSGTLVDKPKRPSPKSPDSSFPDVGALAELLSTYLTSIDHNLTDDEVYELNNELIFIVEKKGYINEKELLAYLANYIQERKQDVSALSTEEILSIVEEQEADEYETKTLIQKIPGHDPINVFDREGQINLPLSIK